MAKFEVEVVSPTLSIYGDWNDTESNQFMLHRQPDGTATLIFFDGYDHGGGVSADYYDLDYSKLVALIDTVEGSRFDLEKLLPKAKGSYSLIHEALGVRTQNQIDHCNANQHHYPEYSDYLECPKGTIIGNYIKCGDGSARWVEHKHDLYSTGVYREQ